MTLWHSIYIYIYSQKPLPSLLFGSNLYHVVADMKTTCWKLTWRINCCVHPLLARLQNCSSSIGPNCKKNINPFQECSTNSRAGYYAADSYQKWSSEALPVTMRGTDRTLCIYRLFACFVSDHIDIHRSVCILVLVCPYKCLLTWKEPRLLIVQECVCLSCTDQADLGRYREPNLAACLPSALI